MADETAWLIENASSQVSRPKYLMVRGFNTGDTQTADGKFEWTENHSYALQFARRDDAVLFIGAIRTLSKIVPHGQTLDGLRSGEIAPRVCEHTWSDRAPPDRAGETPDAT